MTSKIQTLLQSQLKKDRLDVKPGDTVRIHQKIKEKDKERIQVFEGTVLTRKHGKEITATITVRRTISGIGIEKIFPLHSPVIEKIEIVKRGKVRRAKLYYLRKAKGKKARLKTEIFTQTKSQEEPKEKTKEEAGKKEANQTEKDKEIEKTA